MNFWRQTTHIMSYFKEENFRGERTLPSSFMFGFLEVREHAPKVLPVCSHTFRDATRGGAATTASCVYKQMKDSLNKNDFLSLAVRINTSPFFYVISWATPITPSNASCRISMGFTTTSAP